VKLASQAAIGVHALPTGLIPLTAEKLICSLVKPLHIGLGALGDEVVHGNERVLREVSELLQAVCRATPVRREVRCRPEGRAEV
jgi:hypothetical protein